MLNGVQSTMRQRGDCSKCGWGNEKSGLNFYANSLTTTATTDEVGIKSEEERERERDCAMGDRGGGEGGERGGMSFIGRGYDHSCREYVIVRQQCILFLHC